MRREILDLRQCHKTQKKVSVQKVQRLLQLLKNGESFSSKLCLCLCSDNEIEMLNGHHRATALVEYGVFGVSRRAYMFLGEPVSSRFRYRYGKIGDLMV